MQAVSLLKTYQDTSNPYSTEQNNRIHNRLFAGISASVTVKYIKAKKSTTKKRKAKNNKAYLNFVFIIIGAEMPARADYTTVHNATTQQITKHDITSYIGFTLLIAREKISENNIAQNNSLHHIAEQST